MIPFAGAARRITAEDVARAAAKLSCETAALRAVMAVESRNSGYDARRRPIILFEPHVFYRVLPQGKRLLATRAGLAYPRWGQKPYPKTSDANYARLEAASKIDEECAFRAVSIGLGQILGENFKAAGHESAVAMFQAACESEGAQLEQMASFIEASDLAEHLRKKDWRAFALGYNGPGEKRNHYDALLAKAYARWQPLDKPREKLAAKDLRRVGSRTVKGADQVKTGLTGALAAVSAAGAVVAQAQDVVSQANDAVNTAASAAQSSAHALDWAQAHWQALALLIAAAALLAFFWRIWSGAHAVTAARVDDARTGINGSI
ncbi:N-acetylmuramidase family protein [Methylocystis heyeri]|uniref:DUF3380 domain-containing protein n=1 Tax=Methylocystis heyeri TaxID=391905 RepID=A0A6B8KH10_9HYPH|nr:N-acetylmuramidase family protein [Methylocystis heyeri]QGM45848.1 DUF3380 domain-containing protein [Methylocystis heyeri]